MNWNLYYRIILSFWWVQHRMIQTDTNKHLIFNHILLIFKMYIYTARTTGYLNIHHLLIYITSIKDTEKKLCEKNAKRRENFNNKWKNVLKNWLNVLLVNLHLRKNEVDIGSLKPLRWGSLKTQLTAVNLLTVALETSPWGSRWVLPFLIFFFSYYFFYVYLFYVFIKVPFGRGSYHVGASPHILTVWFRYGAGFLLKGIFYTGVS